MQIIGAQGELRIYKIASIPEGIGSIRPKRDHNGSFILAHSEKGHHHVLGGDVDVIETKDSNGMRLLYAIVNTPSSLHQTATNNHDDIMLESGAFLIMPDNEYDPFADMIREVSD